MKNLITSLSDSSLIYLGSWIVSNGHAIEILHSVFFGKNPAINNLSFNEDDANLLLTPALASALNDLTKTALVHRSWYKISERNLISTITRGSNRAQFKILRLKYFGHDNDLWLFVIEGTGHDGTEFSAQLTIEQATKAADSIRDLLEAASRLAITSVETDEINLEISDNVTCGFFQKEKNQTGFLIVNGFHMFIKLSDLQCIPDFVVSGLERIDSLLIPPENNEFSV